MHTLLALAPHPFERNGFLPGHFTASGFVRSPDRASVLLIEHRRLERWLQPGGHVDPDDAGPLAAALREVAEETGCTDLVPIGGDLFGIDVHPIPPRHDEPQHQHFDLQFAFQARADHIEASDEVAAASWVALADVAAFGVDGATRKGVERLSELG
jgi:8-oxo-dGTP pyrophosphatase MutT (NUDIX family)